MMRRDRPPTPGTVIRMAYDGFGVDDIRVRTGYSYAAIAGFILQHPNNTRILPWAKLALKAATGLRSGRAA